MTLNQLENKSWNAFNFVNLEDDKVYFILANPERVHKEMLKRLTKMLDEDGIRAIIGFGYPDAFTVYELVGKDMEGK